jgi:phage/plasmid-associated DNA primase
MPEETQDQLSALDNDTNGLNPTDANGSASSVPNATASLGPSGVASPGAKKKKKVPRPKPPPPVAPDAPWPLPAVWLAAHPEFMPNDLQVKAPNAPIELLIWALHRDKKLVEEMNRFIGEDIVIPPPAPSLSPTVTTATTTGATPSLSPPSTIATIPTTTSASSGISPLNRTQWFAELATAIKRGSFTYDEYLIRRWNPLIIEYGLPPRTSFSLNPLGIPVRYWADNLIWYDPELLTFYLYEPSTGLWRAKHDQEVIRSITEFLVPHAKVNSSYLPSNESVAGVLKTLKALVLKEPSSIPERPIHLANGMYWMSDEDKEIDEYFSPAYYSRNRVPIKYDKANHYHNRFLMFLRATLSQSDIDLLQLWCGMVLLHKNPFHKIMILSGAANSGKSTFINLLEMIMGSENVATMVVDRLEDRFELSEFFGKSLLISKDVSSEFLMSKSVHMLKSLSGDKNIKAEIKYANKRIMLGGPFNIGMTANSNLKVGLQGDMAAWKRRLLVINFRARPVNPLTNEPAITTDLEKILVEEEGTGILRWMMGGAKMILSAIKREVPFPISDEQRNRVHALLSTSDCIESFVAERLTPSPGGMLSTTSLYDQYLEHCDTKDEYPELIAVFERRISPIMKAQTKYKPYTLTAKTSGGQRQRGYLHVAFKSTDNTDTSNYQI